MPGLTGPGTTTPTASASPSEPVDQTVVNQLLGEYRSAGSDPSSVLPVWFHALLLYSEPQTIGTGRAVLQELNSYPSWETGSSGYFFKQQIESSPYIVRSYFAGATPENGYALDPNNLEITITRVDPGDGYTKIFVQSSGADSPRPITLKLNDSGLWQVDEFSSIYAGVRSPKGS